MRIWEAELLNQEAQNEPGKIIACNKVGIDVATKEGVIRLLKIQPPGKRIQTIAEFLNGRPDFAT